MSTAILPTYARADIAFVAGEGPWLEATDGRRFLDFASGVAVNVAPRAADAASGGTPSGSWPRSTR